ncbi:MviN-like protein [Candidatus Thiomargarita nelsonii]|uniref:MviN-like protein n=1 Tax=Candidatus Thiomargarita nelsonii TaxID=1003181 RepID=A0A176S745_9GAMM|nr:MviN-like protein [Candidatus Thiomargarita nelsonii]
MVLNLILIWPLAHAGLALATSLAALLNAGLLYRGLRTQGVFQPQPGWGRFLLRIGIASACMVLLLWWGSGPLSLWLSMDTWARALHLLGWIVASLVVYFASLVIFGFRLHHVNLK